MVVLAIDVRGKLIQATTQLAGRELRQRQRWRSLEHRSVRGRKSNAQIVDEVIHTPTIGNFVHVEAPS